MAFTTTVREVIDNDKTGLLTKHSSWERVQLIEVATILNGAPFDSAMFSITEGHPLIRIRDVLTGTTSTYFRGTYDNAYVVRQGELVVGMDGDFNSAYWGAVPALLNQRVCKITPDENFYSKAFLGHLLPGYLAAINANTSAITVKHLSSKTIGEIELPLPPRPEQTRIVEKLEELLSDLDAGVAELKAAQKKLGQYRQSLLKAAVEGALTAEWRASRKVGAGDTALETGSQLLQRILTERRARWEAKQRAKFAEQGKPQPRDWQEKYPEPVQPDTSDLPNLPDGWVWASVDQLTAEQKYGSSSKTNEDSTGVPILRMGNIQDGDLDFSNLKYLPADHDEFPGLYLQDGDLLFNRTNSPELVGKTAVYRSQLSPCSFASYLISVRFCESYIPELASTFINSAYGKHWIKSVVVQQVGQANVNGSKLAALAIPLPPFDEQKVIVSSLHAQTSEIVEQLKNVETSLKQSAAQRKNILRAAFSGQLVPQDTNDEPASVLLERIRADRDERDKQPKVRKAKQQKEIAAMVSKLMDVLAEAGDWLPAQEAFRRCGVADGAQTEQLEALYAELRALDKAGRLAVEPVTDTQGRKLHDRLKLLAA
ncbi:MAG: restriction endonuclease subunit S [Parachlamydiales bacterium]|jgi:type I restriction enzyme S subunit